jgi:hypothetical protein
VTESGEEFDIDEDGSMEKYRTRKFGQTFVTYFRYKGLKGNESKGEVGK